MITKIKFDVNAIAWLVHLGVLLTTLHAQDASAQRSGPFTKGLYIGIEAMSGSRTFEIKSDLQALKGNKIEQHGRTYGVTLGNRLISGKIRIGNFRASQGDSQPFQSNTFELGSSFSPLQLIAKRTPILEPYLTLSIETTKIKSSGSFTPPPSKPKSSSTCTCTCTSGGSMPDPDALAAAPAVNNPVPYTGSFGSTRLNMGIGLKAHIQKGSLFLTLFGEMNYGVTMGTTASTQALLNTYILNQVAYNVGTSIGIIHFKSSGRRLRKIRFR
jgi:hypothetical protein